MRHFLTLLLAFVTTFVAGCGGGGGSSGATSGGQSFFTTAPSSLTLNVGATQTFSVGGGQSAYSATSSNTSVATVGLSGNTLTVTGVTVGSSTISLRDAAGATQSVSVTVTGQSFFTSAPSTLTLNVGGTGTNYTVGGGQGPYSAASSDTSVLTAELTGSTLKLVGVRPGSANVTLRDALGATQNLAVTVSGPVFTTTAPTSLTLGVGATQSFTVSGGQTPYTVASSNSNVAVPVLSGTTLTVSGLNPGTATLQLRDAIGSTITVGVTVAPPVALSVQIPSGTVLGTGTSNAQTFNINGGVGPYTAISSNNTVVAASVTGNRLTLTGLNAGSANIQVTDATNTSVSSSVTVSSASGTALFTTAPSAITVTRGTTASYSIGGGTAPYLATSSNTGVVTASVSGSTLTLTPSGNGAASVVVRDAIGGTLSIGVTVASAPITLNPSTFSAYIGDVLYSIIQGGSPPYTVLSGFPEGAEATIGSLAADGTFTVNPSGNIVRIRMKTAAAPANIIVSDANGSTASIAVTATANNNAISITPRTLSIGEAFAGDIELTLFGAQGATTIFTTHPNVISVPSGTVAGSTTGTKFKVTKAAVGLCDADATVTITAVDQIGATGTTTFTIVNSDGSKCAP